MKVLYRSVIFLTFLVIGLSFAQDDFVPPDKYFGHRYLGGVKFKMSETFTFGFWGALYFGTHYNMAEVDFFYFNYWDAVPGFSVKLGTLFDDVTLSAGADLYMLRRSVIGDDENYFQFRPRGNFIITMPLDGGWLLQYIHRLERMLHYPSHKILIQFRSRGTLKLTAPRFTSWDIAPYMYYEGFQNRENWYYSEFEHGLNFKPLKGLSVSIAHMVQWMNERRSSTRHQFNLYLFYTVDLSGLFED